jgi:hypothetical protein
VRSAWAMDDTVNSSHLRPSCKGTLLSEWSLTNDSRRCSEIVHLARQPIVPSSLRSCVLVTAAGGGIFFCTEHLPHREPKCNQ